MLIEDKEVKIVLNKKEFQKTTEKDKNSIFNFFEPKVIVPELQLGKNDP